MPNRPRGIAQPAELVKSLNGVYHLMPPGFVKWNYTFGNDWSGDPAVFFWVVLSAEASNPKNLRQVTSAIANIVTQNVDPLNEWGLIPYFSFRSQSEQAELKEEVFD